LLICFYIFYSDFVFCFFFFFSSRRRHTRLQGDWSSDVCSSDLAVSCTSTSPRVVLTITGLFMSDTVTSPRSSRMVSKAFLGTARSEERRVGKECRSRWAAYQ